jgi:fructose-bisphosphate aldolase class II
VLHGASSVIPEYVDMCNQFGGNLSGAQGVPEALLRQAASLGVCKINVDSDLRLAMTGTLRRYFAQNPEHFDPRQYLGPARTAITEIVAHKIRNVMGCSGKA